MDAWKKTNPAEVHESRLATIGRGCLSNLKHLKVDGVPNLARSTHPIAFLFWSVLLISSACLCLALILRTVDQYEKHGVSTTVRVIVEPQAVFPTITVCPINPFTSQFAVDLLAQAGVLHMVDGNQYDNNLAFMLVQHMLNETRGSLLTDAERRNLTDLDALLYSCAFSGSPCSARDFTYMFHPFYLNCYRFNTDGSRISRLSGVMGQLLLQLHADTPPALNTRPITKGVYLFVHNASDYPLLVPQSPYHFAVGQGATLVLDRLFSTQYQSPYSECTVLDDNTLVEDAAAAEARLSDRSLFEAVVSAHNYSYSQQTCLAYCQQYLIAQHCDCIGAQIEFTVPGYGYCLSTEQAKCFLTQSTHFLNSDDISEHCLSRCPLECTQRSFPLTVTSFVFPDYSFNTSYYQMFTNPNFTGPYKNSTSESSFVENIVQLKLYYRSLSYTRIEEEPKMSLEDLIGILGGHLHLFLGMSLLSFAEIFELVKKKHVRRTEHGLGSNSRA